MPRRKTRRNPESDRENNFTLLPDPGEGQLVIWDGGSRTPPAFSPFASARWLGWVRVPLRFDELDQPHWVKIGLWAVPVRSRKGDRRVTSGYVLTPPDWPREYVYEGPVPWDDIPREAGSLSLDYADRTGLWD